MIRTLILKRLLEYMLQPSMYYTDISLQWYTAKRNHFLLHVGFATETVVQPNE